jgi:hypothetical protein
MWPVPGSRRPSAAAHVAVMKNGSSLNIAQCVWRVELSKVYEFYLKHFNEMSKR